MSDYMRDAEPFMPLPPDELPRTWDDVLALDEPDPDDSLDRLSQEGAI